MSYQPSQLEVLQLRLTGRLQAHGNFTNVPVFAVRPRDAGTAMLIQSQIDKTLAGTVGQGGKGGVTILVNMPSADVPNDQAPGPELDIIATLRVIENPLINMGANGTLLSAEELVLQILNVCHLWAQRDIGSSFYADKNAFDPVGEFAAQGLVAYDVRLRIRVTLGGQAKVPMPGLAGNSADGVTALVPPDATVFYTLDGSYPSSKNATAVQAQAGVPIPVAIGALVLAVAYNDPVLQASDLAAFTVSQ